MPNLIPFTPNHRTAARLKAKREAAKRRLIERIGINREDAPLYDEELAFWAYQESLKK